MAQQPLAAHGFLIIEVSRSHSDTILIRTPLDEWSSRSRVPYVTTHNTHKRQTTMSAAGFESAFPVSKRLPTHTLNRADAGMGLLWMLFT